MDALLKQIDFEFKRFNVKKNSIESVFIGGGTPSTINPSLYEKLFLKIAPFLKKNIEITIEANPNSAKKEWLAGIKDLGVNRISFGVQSFNDDKLKFLGRAHNSQEAIKAVEDAFEIGIENISIDIIYDTKIDTKSLLKKDLDLAQKLPINHISAYSLTIEENTFFENKDVKKDDENIGYFIKDNIKFPQYEVSNFGNFQSYHNKGYWQLKDYIGIGCGAVGFLKNERFYPNKDLYSYIKNPIYHTKEKLNENDLRIEKIFLGLRSIIGVEKELLDEKKIKILIEENKIYEKNNKIYNKNFFLADEIALFLI